MNTQPARTLRVDSTGRKFVLLSSSRQGRPGESASYKRVVHTFTSGDLSITLPTTPVTDSVCVLFKGLEQSTSYYSVSGNSLLLLSPWRDALRTGDELVVKYTE